MSKGIPGLYMRGGCLLSAYSVPYTVSHESDAVVAAL